MSTKARWYGFRWRFLLIFVVFTVWLGWYIDRRIDIASQSLPMGQGSAGPAVDSKAFETVWSDRKHVLIGLGDSITRGLGADKRQRHFNMLIENDDEMYPEMSGCDLSSVLTQFEAKNYALDYTTSEAHVKNQLPRVPVYDRDVRGIVVITSGGNDLIHDYGRSEPVDGAIYGCTYEQSVEWTENVKIRIRQLLEGVDEKFSGRCDIFLANLYDPTDGVGDPQLVGLPKWKDCMKVLDLMNAKIAELCDEFDNVHLVDIHSVFIGHGIHCRDFWRRTYHSDDPTYWFYHNLEDPNRRGYDAIRRLFLLEMIKVFGMEGN